MATLAKEVYDLWKNHIMSKVNRPTLEVKCDQKTENFRTGARKFLLDGLKRTESGGSSETLDNDTKICKIKTKKEDSKNKESDADSVEVLAEYIEREVYQTTRRLVNNTYRRTIRKLVFTLRHQSENRVAVVTSTLSVEEFVKQCVKSLA